MNFPGENAGVGFYFLLQWAFLTQETKPASPALAGGFFTTEPPGKLLGVHTEALMASEWVKLYEFPFTKADLTISKVLMFYSKTMPTSSKNYY